MTWGGNEMPLYPSVNPESYRVVGSIFNHDERL